jgi:hypothetical protein
VDVPHGYVPPSEPLRNADAIEHRYRLLMFNRERIEFAYEKAKKDGVDDPVIIVLDLQDERAANMAYLMGLPKEQVAQRLIQCAKRATTPALILTAPRWAALAVVGPMTPNSSQGIVQPNQPDTFRVIVIAAGGNAFADVPTPPSSCLDD